MNLSPRIGFFLSVFAAGTAAAQDSSATAGNAVTRATGLQQIDGVLMAFGPDYKASFTQDGFEFVPALGERAERNLPVRVCVTGIGRGEILAAAPGKRPPLLREDTVVYEHADGVTERLHPEPDGIAWSFLFPMPLTGTGDLVVRAHLVTDLVLTPTGSDGLSLQADGLGGVGIGTVTGIDAAGNTRPGSIRVRGQELELRLPAAFVDQASYPLLLDPLIGTQFLTVNASNRNGSPDVAYNAGNDVYLVVWDRAYSTGDSDIYGQYVTGSGALSGAMFAVDATTRIASEPTIANCEGLNSFFVFWQRADNLLGPYDIYGQRLTATGSGASLPTAIASTAADERSPSAAGRYASRDTNVLVAWEEREQRIVGARVGANALGAISVGTPVTLHTGAGDTAPAIARCPTAASDSFVVAWTQQAAYPTAAKVWAQTVSGTMSPMGSPLAVVSSSTAYRPAFGAVAVDGNGTDFLLAWEDYELPSNQRRNILARHLRWNGTALSAVNAVTSIAARSNVDELQPAVGYLGPKFVVLWAEEVGSFDRDILGLEVSVDCQACGVRFRLTGTTSGPIEQDPAIATKRSAGANSNDGLIVFEEQYLASLNFYSGLCSQRITAFGSGGAVTPVGSACGTTAAIGSSGAFAVGNADFFMTLSGAPTAALVAADIGLPGGEISCGSCVLTNPASLVIVAASGGSASLRLPIPCNASLQGLPLSLQWLLLNAGSSPCPLVPGLAATRRLQATLGF